MFEKIKSIKFPQAQDININMMPIIMSDDASVPRFLHHYLPLINSTNLEKNSVVYLTINETLVKQGVTQRRAGQHTDATASGRHGGKGGGKHGGSRGIYLASTDGDCEAWQTNTTDVDELGGLNKLFHEPGEKFEPNCLYLMDDTTPHASLPASIEHYRQFFRLTGPELSIWWAKHNTPNPLGVLPNAKIKFESKF